MAAVTAHRRRATDLEKLITRHQRLRRGLPGSETLQNQTFRQNTGQ
jgi:hypothetical protein